MKEVIIILLLITNSGEVDGSFIIDLSVFSPGPHSLSITATSDGGEVVMADIINFSVPDPLGNHHAMIEFHSPTWMLILQMSGASVRL